MISINDTPEVREIFAGLEQVPIETTYTIGTKASGGKRVGELLISNFAPCDAAIRAAA